MINLNKYKENKRVKLIIRDLEKINQIVTRQIGELKPYSKYELVKICLNAMEESQYVLNNYLKRYKTMVNNDKVE